MNDLDRAIKAKAVLDSQAYQDAFKAVRESLIAGIEKCPMSDTKTAEDFRRCLKLLTALQNNLVGALQSGKVAEFRLEQKRLASLNPFRKINRDRP